MPNLTLERPAQAAAQPVLNTDAAAFFQENGYLVVEDALSREEVEELRRETLRICRGELGEVKGVSPVSGQSDEETLRRYLCIHMPHKLSPVMLKYLSHPAIVDVLTRVISPNVKAMQSMLFIKAAGKPGQAWHQDEDYIPTRDRSLCGAWVAMDDATVENGCLWIIPGSHKPGVLWPQEWHGDERFDCAFESRGFHFSDEDAIPVEVRAGAVVFFNGYTLHRSLPNTAPGGFRRCLVNHYMSAESFLPWRLPKQGEQMAMADYRDIVMVAGTDPFAAKGIEEIAEAGVRPDGKSGCLDWLTGDELPYNLKR